MALGSTHPLTEMSTRNIPGDKERPAHKAYNLTAICESVVYKMWEPQRLTTVWVSRPVTGIALLFLVPYSSALLMLLVIGFHCTYIFRTINPYT
jgi:hypothetical protein